MKIGVVIQGPVRNFHVLNKNVNSLRQSFKDEAIVISTWEEEGKVKREQDTISDDNGNLFGIKTLRSTTKNFERFAGAFDAVNVDNIVYQAYTTSKGIQFLNDNSYDFIIKVRTDEYYNDLSLLEKDIEEYPDKIHSGSLFFRNDFPFHYGDHLVAGSYHNLYNMYVGFLQYSYDILADEGGKKFFSEWKNKVWNKIIFNNIDGDISKLIHFTYSDIPPEVKLAVTYLKNKIGSYPECKDQKELMNKYFNPIDVRRFKEFYFTANSVAGGTVLTEKNIEPSGKFKFEYTKCKEAHEDWLLCNVDEQNALLKRLLQSEVRSQEDIKDLTSDFEIYASVYRAIKVLDEYKDRTRLQNFKY
jgi:hypothetical protein